MWSTKSSNLELFTERTAESDIKWSGYLLVVFLVKLLYGIDLIRITKPASEKRNAIDTLRIFDFLLIKRSTKQDKYAVNPNLETFCDVSVFLHNKICPFLRQGICNYVGHSILWNTIELIILICLLALMGPRIYSVSHKCHSFFMT